MIPGMTGPVAGFASGVLRSITQTDVRSTLAAPHSDVEWGPAIPGSWVLLFAHHDSTPTDPGTTPTATIGGVPATRHIARSTGSGGGSAAGAAIFSAQPAGTSGTVTVSWNSLPTAIVVARVIGYDLSSAFATNGATTGSGTVSLDVPSNGLIVGNVKRSRNDAITWTNLTEIGDEILLNGALERRHSWGWDAMMPQEAARSISYSPFESILGINAVTVASFSPS